MEYEDVNISTKDKINLHGWFIKQTDSKTRPTIIYFHENAGSKKICILIIRYWIQNSLHKKFICSFKGKCCYCCI